MSQVSEEKEDSPRRFTIEIKDYFKMRGWDINQSSIDGNDIGHMRYILNRMPQKTQEFVIQVSKMFVEAAELNDDGKPAELDVL